MTLCGVGCRGISVVSRFSHIARGPREDLPGVTIKSRDEANVTRILKHLQEQRLIAHWEKSDDTEEVYFFPGQGKTGNYAYRPDWRIILPDYTWYLIERKGSLKEGGLLAEVALSTISDYDSDSRIKLERMTRHYKWIIPHLYVIGEREMKWLDRTFSWLPHYELPAKKKRAA